mmetsp:Transcript_19068/g.72888  ORF Transcript_19068/g.72888 Transcript_19068/m.72888 type:complete len:335 (-) Transcript_19068:4708-5712(-)
MVTMSEYSQYSVSSSWNLVHTLDLSISTLRCASALTSFLRLSLRVPSRFSSFFLCVAAEVALASSASLSSASSSSSLSPDSPPPAAAAAAPAVAALSFESAFFAGDPGLAASLAWAAVRAVLHFLMSLESCSMSTLRSEISRSQWRRSSRLTSVISGRAGWGFATASLACSKPMGLCSSSSLARIACRRSSAALSSFFRLCMWASAAARLKAAVCCSSSALRSCSMRLMRAVWAAATAAWRFRIASRTACSSFASRSASRRASAYAGWTTPTKFWRSRLASSASAATRALATARARMSSVRIARALRKSTFSSGLLLRWSDTTASRTSVGTACQ